MVELTMTNCCKNTVFNCIFTITQIVLEMYSLVTVNIYIFFIRLIVVDMWRNLLCVTKNNVKVWLATG